jgi:putative membrane protein
MQRWVINTVAVLVACYLVKGIHYLDIVALFVASLLLGIFNTFLRPLLILLTLPLVLVSLGLFTFVINALLLWLIGSMLRPKFEVDGFVPALLGAIIISLVSIALNTLTGTGGARVRVQSSRDSRRGTKDPRDGGGPVIDV